MNNYDLSYLFQITNIETFLKTRSIKLDCRTSSLSFLAEIISLRYEVSSEYTETNQYGCHQSTDNFFERQHNSYHGDAQQRKAAGPIAKPEESWEKALASASWKRYGFTLSISHFFPAELWCKLNLWFVRQWKKIEVI